MTFVHAATTTPPTTIGSECANRPFTTKAERAKVRQEDPACYVLRSNYGTAIQGDMQPLQDTSGIIDWSRYQETLSDLANLLEQLESNPDSFDDSSASTPADLPGQPTSGSTTEASAPNDAASQNPDDFAPISYITGLPYPTSTQTSDHADTNTESESDKPASDGRVFVGNFRSLPAAGDNQNAFADFFYRPALHEPSRLLAPNMYVIWRDFFLMTRQEPLPPNVPLSRQARQFNWQPVVFAQGIYAPIQNLILGAANGLIAFLVDTLQ